MYSSIQRQPPSRRQTKCGAAQYRSWPRSPAISTQPSGLAGPDGSTHAGSFAQPCRPPAFAARARRFLRPSPEFSCKKLLAGGERRIFEFARSFRNRERGPLHHPEFTLVEWYRVDAPYELLMEDCGAILALGATIAGSSQLSWRGRTADPLAAPDRLTVGEAFSRHAGIALDEVLPPRPTSVFAAAARKAGVRLAADDSWGDIFSRVLVECIEPLLGNGRATILYEYPAIQSPLARPLQRDPRLAERFELYVCGVELANGFGELTDPAEQRRRLEEQMAEKERVYGARYPLDEEFLAALALMPQASGVALGFDRLVMLATGARRIDDVLWTSVAEVE